MIKRARDQAFQKAIYASLVVHMAVFVLILVSPSLPKPSRKGMIHYIPLNMLAAGGGGGGGNGKPAGAAAAAPVKKETLRDLTTPQKLKQEEKSSLRYPVDKPKKEPKVKTDKKAVISKPEPTPPEKAPDSETTAGVSGGTGTGGGFGTGLRIGGTGGGPGGPGFGSGLGLANFPYTYYLNIITERVSSNWFSSLVDPGVSGNFQTIIFFRIQKDGQVSELKIEQSSGITPLDLSALRAVRTSAPFPPLPRDYEDAYLAIHLIFEHSK